MILPLQQQQASRKRGLSFRGGLLRGGLQAPSSSGCSGCGNDVRASSANGHKTKLRVCGNGTGDESGNHSDDRRKVLSNHDQILRHKSQYESLIWQKLLWVPKQPL